jgi:hypothetical protein
MSMKNSIGTIGNRTHELPVCSAVPQPTAPPHTPETYSISNVNLRHMFATTEEHYNKVTFKNNANQILSIMTDALMYSVHKAFHYMDIRGDTAYLSS